MTTTMNNSVRNGVDTAALFATIDAVKGDPELAKFQFRATNRWVSGTHNRSTIHGFYGAKQEMTAPEPRGPTTPTTPPCSSGEDNGPTPVEFLLHALAACLTSGLANIAAARGVKLTEVEATVEGDIDLLGILGLSDEVRNGFEQIRVSFAVARRRPGEAARRRRAVAPALGGLRHPHQRRAGRRSTSTPDERPTTSVVVGARAAGAATARLLARVRAARPARRPRQLRRRHAVHARADARRRAAARTDGDCSTASIAAGTPGGAAGRRSATPARSSRSPIKPSHGVDALYAPRRTVLDPILVDAAAAAGAEVRFGVAVTDVERDGSGRGRAASVGRDRDGRAVLAPARHRRRRRRDPLDRRRAGRRADRAGRHRRRRVPPTATGPASTSTGTSGTSAPTPRPA